MNVVISMLRAINVGGHNNIRMQALRALYESLGLLNVQTHLQSGNVVFRTKARDVDSIARRIESEIEKVFHLGVIVIVRSALELRNVIERNPFAGRPDVEPNRLLVMFLAAKPDAIARERVLMIKPHPEEFRLSGREVYVYYPNGLARPKLSMALIERTLKVSGTARNWNTVTKLCAIAEEMESAEKA